MSKAKSLALICAIAALFFAFVAVEAHATEKYPVELVIIHTPTYEDGTPFPRQDLLHYRVCISSDGVECSSIVDTPENKVTINDAIGPNETLHFKVKAFDKNIIPGKWSNTITKTVAIPSAPVLENVKIIIVIE
jgi:hypothetical protein